MNAFRKTIDIVGLGDQSQGAHAEYGWAYLLLSALADADDESPIEATYPANPIKEVLHRLSTYRDTFAGQRLTQMLTPFADRFPT